MKSCTCSSLESPTAAPRPSFDNCDRRNRAQVPSWRLRRKPSKLQTTVEVTKCRLSTTSRQAVPIGLEDFVPQKSWPPIFHAAFHNREAALQHFLRTGVSADIVEDGVPLLCVAAACGHLEIVKILLEAGAFVDATCEDKGETALHIAVKGKYYDIVDLLLVHRVKLETQTSHTGQTALHYAAGGSGAPEMVVKLLKSGANYETLDLQRRSPAAIALQAGNLRAAVVIVNMAQGKPKQLAKEKALLLQHMNGTEGQSSTADDLILDILIATCEADSTILIEAIKRNNAKLVEKILDQGADPHRSVSKELSPIIVAAKFADLRIIKLLVQHGADVTVRGPGDLDILQFLFKTLSTRNEAMVAPVVEYLLAKGADISSVYSDGKTLLHRAVSAQVDHAQVVKLLLKEGVELNAQDTDGSTALHLAAANGLRYTTRALLDARADTAIIDFRKRTALLCAVQKKQWALVPILAVSPAITSWDADGSTVLHHIARSTPRDSGSWMDVAAATKPFCEWGICRSMRDRTGATPLIIATRSLPEEGLPVIESLLTEGEKKWNCVGHEDHKSRDALYYATLLDKLAFVKALLDYGAPFVLEEWTDGKRGAKLSAGSKSQILELLIECDRTRRVQQSQTKKDTALDTHLILPQSETRASSAMSGYCADYETERKSKVNRSHLRKATSDQQLRVSAHHRKPVNAVSNFPSRTASLNHQSREAGSRYRKSAHSPLITLSQPPLTNQPTKLAKKTVHYVKQSYEAEGMNRTAKEQTSQRLTVPYPSRAPSQQHVAAEPIKPTESVVRGNKSMSRNKSSSKRSSPTRSLETVEELEPHAEVTQTPPPPKAPVQPSPVSEMLTLSNTTKSTPRSTQYFLTEDMSHPTASAASTITPHEPITLDTTSSVTSSHPEIEKTTKPARVDSGVSLMRGSDAKRALPELDRSKSILDSGASKANRQSGDELEGWLAISNMLDRL